MPLFPDGAQSEAADASTYTCPATFRWLQGLNELQEKIFISTV